MANATLGYQGVGAQGLRPFRSMANATLRYQQTLNIAKINNIARLNTTFLSICQ
ncbi:MAG: hypothetical protein HEQ13_12915 [Dolichospermum sp. DEX189]|jgi:hypothetical protein|uniref:CpcB n=1 Tax=Aphanizomenon flos-aquae FACHB-1040 TaxID=2692887 RepID=A0ABR8BQX7_APHFL|nr:hypothetical protein [Aphanizomenon flos-aquae]MBD2277187.1 hypothetical protein [Aphanizomenon flos-aquae FACHB-1040]MBO1070216.1 hypothetical protein [Dolichospermum sp. DEX189]